MWIKLKIDQIKLRIDYSMGRICVLIILLMDETKQRPPGLGGGLAGTGSGKRRGPGALAGVPTMDPAPPESTEERTSPPPPKKMNPVTRYLERNLDLWILDFWIVWSFVLFHCLAPGHPVKKGSLIPGRK